MTIWDSGRYETLKWAKDEVKVRLHGQRVTGATRCSRPGEAVDDAPGAPAAPAGTAADAGRAVEHATAGRREMGAGVQVGRGARAGLRRARPGPAHVQDRTGHHRHVSRTGRAGPRDQPQTAAAGRGDRGVRRGAAGPSSRHCSPRMHVSDASQAGGCWLTRTRSPTWSSTCSSWTAGRCSTWSTGTAARCLDELGLAGPNWQTPPSFPGEDFEAVRAVSRDHGMEGVVAKRLDSRYLPGAGPTTGARSRTT